jgi:hypothetical protein
VSFVALELVYDQIQLARKISDLDKDICSGRFTKSMGLPCKHVIKQRLNSGEVLRLTDFDTSWHLRSFGLEYRRPVFPPLTRERDLTRSRRTNGSKSSTRRLESGFKKAARETAQRIAYEQGKKCYRCSACGPKTRWGHKKSQPICPRHPKHDEWL